MTKYIDVIYSFDIFDTCLTRLVARPTDLFLELADIVLPELCPYGYSNQTIIDFYRIRRLAERLARQQQRGMREDISIVDIYKIFEEIAPWNNYDIDLILAELTLENKLTFPIQSTYTHVSELHAKGNNIIFISDMYLPTQFLTDCLILHGFYMPGDIVYVSGDIGLSKSTGRLFSHVLNNLCLPSYKLVHVGDNYISDFIVPSTMGIQASLFNKALLTPHENLGCSFINSAIESKIIGLNRLSRLIEQDVLSYEFTCLLADIISPTLTAYVAWLINDAKEKGITRLYFVSRDGQILYKIAQRLTIAWGGPECRYLYGSRQAWFLASVTEVSHAQLSWLLSEIESKTLYYIFQRLNLHIEDVIEVLAYTPFADRIDKILTNSDKDAVLEILQNPIIASMILTKSNACREMAVNYFAQEGLFSNNVNWAIVDIGWTLKCQKALQSILQHHGFDKKLFGYYFGVRSALIDKSQNGQYLALLEDGKQYHNTYYRHFNGLFYAGNMALIEHVFTMADHPTVVSYQCLDNYFIPVYRETLGDEFVNNVHLVQNNILKYVDKTLQNGFSVSEIPMLLNYSISSLKVLLLRPTVNEALSVSDFSAYIDQGHSITRPLATRLSWKNVGQIILNQFNLLPPYELSGPLWLEGSAVLSTLPVRWAITALLIIKRLFRRMTYQIL